ncbi:hypothetical protein LEP1GSC187_2025 [Leptospira santarosai str. ZUN179]|uniref:Uncharacterized protein n=1 Tax=Leptospira santarosai str. ZUN179 TaxID=1049985 RepID=M6UQF8_9LEPT|nr:hypothetical protein LEP1GSC187_2025 [Leptospira santarosai str. ZUN179]
MKGAVENCLAKKGKQIEFVYKKFYENHLNFSINCKYLSLR